jgi:hypothetical protein
MKKGTIILLIASLSFLVTTALFFNAEVKRLEIASAQYQVIGMSYNAEKIMLYIDLAAKAALKDALKDNRALCRDIKKCEAVVLERFIPQFMAYTGMLNNEFKLDIDTGKYNFKLIARESRTTGIKQDIELIGTYSSKLALKKKDVIYSIRPNFNVIVD